MKNGGLHSQVAFTVSWVIGLCTQNSLAQKKKEKRRANQKLSSRQSSYF